MKRDYTAPFLTLVTLLVAALPVCLQAQFSPISATTEPTIVPGRVSILVEADTYTPWFYILRAEPTTSSDIRATAVLLPATLNPTYYEWRIGDTVREYTETAQTHTVLFTAPYTPDVTLTVRVYDANRQLLAEGTDVIRLSEPTVAFYEYNPLRSHLLHAIGESLLQIGEEVVVKAEPYFLPKQFITSSLYTEWSVNRKTVPAAEESPFTLVLQNTGEQSGSYLIDFVLKNYAVIGQSVKNQFRFIVSNE